MTKNAAIHTTDNDGVRQAKRAFVFGLLDISWKLALAFLIPTLIGVILDSGASSGSENKTYTVFGVMTGFILAALVIYQVSRRIDLTAPQVAQAASKPPRRHK